VQAEVPEFDAWLGRARYERRAGLSARLRNGFRPRKVQTAECELSVEIPQVREAGEPFVSKLFPHGTKLLRTEPLKAMVIGAFVRSPLLRESSRVGTGRAGQAVQADHHQDLPAAARALEGRTARDLYVTYLAALNLDATFLAVRLDPPRRGRPLAIQRRQRRRAARSPRGLAYDERALALAQLVLSVNLRRRLWT
jgi:hypothetical protein